MSGIDRLLVTEREADRRWDLWQLTAAFANWLEGRNNAHGTTTWIITIDARDRNRFVAAARDLPLTVELIEGAGDTETYVMLAGEQGTGWAPAPVQACRVCGCTEDEACDGGCSWVAPDLCSACADRPESSS